MTEAVYRIVEHDGGWAYKLGDVFSETFPNRQAAAAAAAEAAQEQQVPGEDESISWEDEAGRWHDETARGTDRPHAYVAEAAAAREAAQAVRATAPAPEPGSLAGEVGDYAFAAYDRGDQYATQGARLLRGQVRGDPMLAMLVAALCGFLIGLVVRRQG